MTIVVWLMIGIAVIVGAIYIIGAVLSSLGEAADSASKGVAAIIEGNLGRKRLGLRAAIPEELQEGMSPLPKHDPEKDEFLTYKPEPHLTQVPNRVEFIPYSLTVFKEPREPSAEIDIERIREILVMSSSRPFEPAFSVISESPVYPVPAPKRPKDIEPPPSWTSWKPVLGEPRFELPLWSGWRSIFNRYVVAAYRDEQTKVVNALARRKAILDQCNTRNTEVSALLDKALMSHQKAAMIQEKDFVSAVETQKRNAAAFFDAFREERSKMNDLRAESMRPGAPGLAKRIEMSMKAMALPSFVSYEGETKFDQDSGIIIHEHRFPDPEGVEWIKFVELKSGWTKKPANQKEKKEAAAKLHPSLCLRLAAEIARLDDDEIVKAIAVNGWADYTEKSTGQRKRAYCASLFATKEQILSLKLSALDPIEAFLALKGVAARSLEMAPIAPIIRLNTNDPRFVDAKDVLSKLTDGENLAAMDWEDFEHLCRELFERAFASTGAEVKVTQASRDQGVDAVVFDPDPLRGGKIVIQAKRYTNTVDVSAVRDLYGAVINEGAVKGILVTTSQYGPESYSFAKDKPLTLLNGNELLGLLEQHGYKFRINLAEAKRMIS